MLLCECCWIPPGYCHCTRTGAELEKDEKDNMYTGSLQEAEQCSGYCWSGETILHFVLNMLLFPHWEASIL